MSAVRHGTDILFQVKRTWLTVTLIIWQDLTWYCLYLNFQTYLQMRLFSDFEIYVALIVSFLFKSPGTELPGLIVP